MSKFLNYCIEFYNKIIKSAFWLGILAFAISCINYSGYASKIIVFLIPVFLFTVKNKKIASFKQVLVFSGIFAVLRFVLGMGLVIYGTIKALLWIPLLSAFWALLYSIFDFIAAIIVFYLVNLVVTGLIKLFSKNKYTDKINRFVDYLFLKAPQILLIAGIGCIIFVNLFQTFTMEKGKFVRCENFEMGTIAESAGIAYGADKAIILKPALKLEYKIFDSNKRKFIYSGTIENYKPTGGKLHCAWLNDDELLIIQEGRGNKEEANKVDILILNVKSHNCDYLGKFPLDINFAFSVAKIDDGSVLIAGGAGYSNQTYIFKDKKLEKIQNLKNGYIEPKILPYKDDSYILIGKINNNANEYDNSKLGIDVYNFKNKTSKTLLIKEMQDGGAFSLKDAFLFENKLAVFLESFLHEEEFIVIDLETLKEISDVNFNLGVSDSSVVQLSDGNLLVTGGMSGYMKYSRKAYIYNFKTGKFTEIKSKTNANRTSGKTILLNNGNVLIYGGSGGEWTIKSVEMFVP